MKSRSSIRRAVRGSVTTELVALMVILGMPLLMALSELARFDRTARALQFSLQAKCLAHASAQMRESERRFLTVEGDAPFRSRFGPFRQHIFKRHYVIATGTGYGDWFE